MVPLKIKTPAIGMKGRKWQNILKKMQVKQEKIRGQNAAVASVGLNLAGSRMRNSEDSTVAGLGAAAQVAGTAASAVSLHQTGKSLTQNAETVAKAWKIPIKGHKKAVILTIFLPTLILLALYIPEFVMSAKATDQRIERMTCIMDQLEQTMEQPGWEIYKSDVSKGDEDEYTMYLKNSESPLEEKFFITIHESGVITALNWMRNQDTALSPEDNLENLGKFADETLAKLSACNPEYWTDSFETGNCLQGELVKEYLEGFDEGYGAWEKTDDRTKYGFQVSRNFEEKLEMKLIVRELKKRR